MEGYYGIVESVIRRGEDAYQLTFRVKHAENAPDGDPRLMAANPCEVLIYRADITIEDDRFTLFPDRALSRCIDALSGIKETGHDSDGLDKELEIGRVADRICRKFSSFLLEHRSAELRSAKCEKIFVSDVNIIGDMI